MSNSTVKTVIAGAVLAAVGSLVWLGGRDAAVTPAAQPTPAQAKAGGGERVPRLQQLTVPSGSTAVDAAAGVRYEVQGAAAGEVEQIIRALRRQAAYVGADGSNVDALVLREQSPRVRLDPVKGLAETDARPTVLRIMPARTLLRDTWYTLRIGTDSSYAVRSLDVASREGEVDFFTGSAPQVRYVSFTDPAKGGERMVQVFMSEPVDMASVASANFALGGWSGPMTGCVHREGNCMSASAKMSMTGFDFKVEGADAAVGPYVERITLRAGMHGAGRSVGDSMRVSGAHRGTARASSVEYITTVNEWFNCAGDAMAWCWVAPRNR